MTLTRADLVTPPSSAGRWLRLTLVAAVTGALSLTLVACGSSKPKPAALESFRPALQTSLAWTQRFDDMKGPMMLAVQGGVVTLATTDGDIVALDVKSGAPRWRADAGTRLTAAVGGDGRYASVVTDGNELLAFDQGKLLWRERLPGRVITPPLVAGERVFVQAIDRSVRAYDVLDGRWLWQYQRPGGEPLALATPGVISAFRDTLLVGQGARLVGLDPTKGGVRFDLNLATPRGSNEVERLADLVGPIARADDEVCARAFQLAVGCMELNRGSVRWTKPQSGTQAVAANDSIVIGADSTDRLTAWKTENGDVVWRADRFTYRELSAPAIWDRYVALADGDGYLHLLALEDGRTVGRFELDAALAAPPLVSDGLLLLATRKGTVYALRHP
ncbi:MAG: outer membrane protein assembly factor BamB [Aquabacterium sp.]